MRNFLLGLAILGTSALGLAIVQSGIKVTLDGKPLSSRGFVRDGQVYIPASDVAKALGKSYAYDKAKKTARLGTAGGTVQSTGVDGKAGETLFNGVTRLTVGTQFIPGDPYTLLDFEARNGENKEKTYHFGFTSTKYTLFDAAGQSVEGEMKNNDHYAVDLPPAEFRKFQVSFRFPAGFQPVRMVVRLSTQVPGNPAKIEVFRVAFH